jgi:hypothetical protein
LDEKGGVNLKPQPAPQNATKKQLSQTSVTLTPAEINVLRQKKKAMCDFAQRELTLRLRTIDKFID